MPIEIIDNPSRKSIQQFVDENKFPTGYGVVYTLEYGDVVKIGSTSNILNRFSTLKSKCMEYANRNITRIAISNPHSDYKLSESILHRWFNYFLIKNELFKICIEDAIHAVNFLKIGIDSSEIIEKVYSNDLFIRGLFKGMMYSSRNKTIHEYNTRYIKLLEAISRMGQFAHGFSISKNESDLSVTIEAYLNPPYLEQQ